MRIGAFLRHDTDATNCLLLAAASQAKRGHRKLPVFDPDFYRSRLPDGGDASDPLSSYVATSCRPGTGSVRPSNWFDPAYYYSVNKVPCENGGPLLHYLGKGVFERRYSDKRIEEMVLYQR